MSNVNLSFAKFSFIGTFSIAALGTGAWLRRATPLHFGLVVGLSLIVATIANVFFFALHSTFFSKTPSITNKKIQKPDSKDSVEKGNLSDSEKKVTSEIRNSFQDISKKGAILKISELQNDEDERKTKDSFQKIEYRNDFLFQKEGAQVLLEADAFKSISENDQSKEHTDDVSEISVIDKGSQQTNFPDPSLISESEQLPINKETESHLEPLLQGDLSQQTTTLTRKETLSDEAQKNSSTGSEFEKSEPKTLIEEVPSKEEGGNDRGKFENEVEQPAVILSKVPEVIDKEQVIITAGNFENSEITDSLIEDEKEGTDDEKSESHSESSHSDDFSQQRNPTNLKDNEREKRATILLESVADKEQISDTNTFDIPSEISTSSNIAISSSDTVDQTRLVLKEQTLDSSKIKHCCDGFIQLAMFKEGNFLYVENNALKVSKTSQGWVNSKWIISGLKTYTNTFSNCKADWKSIVDAIKVLNQESSEIIVHLQTQNKKNYFEFEDLSLNMKIAILALEQLIQDYSLQMKKEAEKEFSLLKTSISFTFNSLIGEIQSEKKVRIEFIDDFLTSFLHPYITGQISKKDEVVDRKPMLELLFEKMLPISQKEKKVIEELALKIYVEKASLGLYVHLKKKSTEGIASFDELDLLFSALKEALALDFPDLKFSEENLKEIATKALSDVYDKRKNLNKEEKNRVYKSGTYLYRENILQKLTETNELFL